jgi:hypothetical protein
MELDKSQSKSLSHASSRLSKKKSDVVSDDISMSQLELLANKRKLNKKSDDISLDNNNNNVVDNNKSIHSVVSSKSVKNKSVTTKSSTRKSSRNNTSSSDSTGDRKYDRRKINKENKNETTRKEKSELLFKLHTIIEKSNGRWSCKMTMDNSLDEIRNEFTRIKSILDNESMVKFCKHGLVMGIKGIEMLNGAYDPIGVDLDGWSEAMSYSMATTEYDEVLSELCEKYKGTGSMSPEVKLLLMIIMSGAMFSFSKKAAKDPNTLTNLMGSFMKKSQSPQQPPQRPPQQFTEQPSQQFTQQPLQQFTQQEPKSSLQQYYDASQSKQTQDFFEPPRGFFPQTQNRIPNISDLQRQKQQDVDTEDSDNIPSKIRGPSFDSPDSVNIEQIIKTMREKNKQKNVEEVKIRPDIEQILNETETSEEIVRNIPPPKTRGKGRPRKNATKPSARNA